MTTGNPTTGSSSPPEEEVKEEINWTEEFEDEPNKTMKVTLLSGFLGAGKTTLLKRLLRVNNELENNNDKKLKIAVIVNDMGEINLDAEEIKSSKIIQEDAEMVELHNGCICELLKTVKSLSEEGTFDYLVIESTGISEPLPVAQTFTMDVDSMTESGTTIANSDVPIVIEQLDSDDERDDKIKENNTSKKLVVDDRKSLFHFAKLDTCVTVVDSLNIYDVLSSIETLADKDNVSGMAGNGPNIANLDSAQMREQQAAVVAAAMNMKPSRLRDALKGRNLDMTGNKKTLVKRLIEEYEKEIFKSYEDNRSIANLWLDQIEFANVIIISKVPQFLEHNNGDTNKLKEIEDMLQKLNPDARIIVPYADKYADLDVSKTLINTGLFDMEQARQSASWARELEMEHNPGTLEYGISSTTFIGKDRPFHPERLQTALAGLGDLFMALLGGDGNGHNDVTYQRVFKGVVRIKGQIWLANCPVFPMNFQTAGKHVQMGLHDDPFLVEKPKSNWNQQDKDAYDWMVENGWWSKKWGDRRSQLVFIGVGLNRDRIHKSLNDALVTEEEMTKFGGLWGLNMLKDPFYNGQLLQKCATYYGHVEMQQELEAAEAKQEENE